MRQSIVLFNGDNIRKTVGRLNFQTDPRGVQWLLLRVNTDFVKYYQYLFKYNLYQFDLSFPRNNGHVTLANSKEVIFDEKRVDKLINRKYSIEYINTVKTDGLSYWFSIVNLDCMEMLVDSVIIHRIKSKRMRIHLTILNKKHEQQEQRAFRHRNQSRR